MTAALTAPTSTITAAPAKENIMYAASNTLAQTVADLIEARGGHYERISEYVDPTPPEYDEVSAYGLSLIDLAIEGRATGELSPEAFDDAFSSALAMERKPTPVQASTAWPFTDEEQVFFDDLQTESRSMVYTPPVNGVTETDRLSVAAARRQEADAEYASMLANQELIEEIAQLDFSGLTPLVSEYDFSDLYTMEMAA